MLKDESEFPRKKRRDRAFKADASGRAEPWDGATCLGKASAYGWNIRYRGNEKMLRAN